MIRDNSRQRSLVPPERLAAVQAVVIGVGAGGRQAALQLAALGISKLVLIDHDTVEPENLVPQGYFPADLSRLKVEATADLCRQIHPEIELTLLGRRFRRSDVSQWQEDDLVIFCCVDSIETRKLIWEAVRSRAALFIDGRMASEVVRILASDCPLIDNYYETTLFAASEAYVGACTSRSTIYMGNISAALKLHQFTRWLRGLPVEKDQTLNLLAAELIVPEAVTA